LINQGASGLKLEDLLIETNWTRCRPPLPEGEVRAIARSVERTVRSKGGVR
jgi:hypothetical protein